MDVTLVRNIVLMLMLTTSVAGVQASDLETALVDRCWSGENFDSTSTVIYARDHTFRIREYGVGAVFTGKGTWRVVGRKLLKQYDLRMEGSTLPPQRHMQIEVIRELTGEKLVTDWYTYHREHGKCI